MRLVRRVCVALLLLLCRCGAGPRTLAHRGPPLTVVTYNILAGDRGLKGIAETLGETKADLIGLQEVDVGTRRSGRVDEAAKLGEALKMHHAFVPHFAFQGGQFGVALLSRFPIESFERVGVRGSTLGVLKARVRTPSGPLTVVVVHLHVTFPFEAEKLKRANDAARLREAQAAFAAAGDGPALVVGDFNDDTGSPPYDLMETKFQDACAGKLWAKTWNSALPITRIDYVWASRHFEVEACGTRASLASDHLPVVARVIPTP